jgi:ATP-dependent helicase/DNAse subunit B
MSLELIVGPPNSGRAGEILARLRAALERDPLLVVPTGDDIARFERDLCEGDRPAIGATIRTFASLFEAVADVTALGVPPQLSQPQRLALVRAATAATPLRLLSRSASAPGFASALDLLIAELQAALVTPADLRAAIRAAEGDGTVELEIAALYEEYERLRDGAGRADAGSLAVASTAALRADPQAWSGRPVLIYGFDDLTEAQLDLVSALAETAEVTIAVNYADRPALAARAGLLRRLLDDGGEVVRQLAFDRGYTDRATLRQLDEALFEPEAETVADDGGVRLLECAGERGEAEGVGIEIAKLLAGGTEPDEIVVALRHPAVDGPLFAAVLHDLGIPATLEAQLPLTGTAVGRALLLLCRAASPAGEPADALGHLRADTAFRQSRVDWAERAALHGEADSVGDLLSRFGEHPPTHLDRVLGAGRPVQALLAVAVSARRLAEAAHRERAPLAGERSQGVPLDPVELRAAVAAAELLEELAVVARLPGLEEPGLDDAAEALESATVRTWQGSTEGRVRIVSPYRVRAGRARHLFLAAMQEGSFPGRGEADPLLGEESRKRLGIPALRRQEQEQEERYLFHVCVSRPVERLTLSWRSSDDEGRPTPRSPFVDEVLDLIGPDPEAAEEALKDKRGLGEVVPGPADASTPRALARALTLRHRDNAEAQARALDAIGADLTLRGEVLGLIANIPDPSPAALPGPLRDPTVLGELGSRAHVSAGSLENWIECSYRWFVAHELAPERLQPVADPLWLGGIVHDALHRLYREPPGEDAIPREQDADRWKRRFGELVATILDEREGEAMTPERRLALARAVIQVEAFLDEEAASGTPLRPSPDLLERGFGFEDENDDAGELDLGEFALRGRIDRIDVEPGGKRALLRDYKTSQTVPGRSKLADEGKLQLPLYMLVARERLGLDPVGGVYYPLAAYKNRRARGIVLRDETGEGGVLEGVPLSLRRGRGDDSVERDEFEAALSRARQIAVERGTEMRAGQIRRNPIGGRCPKYCEYQPICRLERAVGIEDDDSGTREGNGNGNGNGG